VLDGLFASGALSEADRAAHIAALDEVDPAVADARAQAEAGLTPEEQAEHDRLSAKAKAAAGVSADG
jgi:hypothetical protein